MPAPSFLVLMIAVAAAAGCPRADAPPPPGPASGKAVVATVGGEPIYARDFVLNYEFGFAHLFRGDNPRLVYLNRVVEEKLLALEGRRRGLLSDGEVAWRREDLLQELLVEQVFDRYVNARVSVTEEEVTESMQRERTSFRLRYLPARTAAHARELRQEARTRGLPALVEEFVAEARETDLHPSEFESPYITSHELHPDLLAAIVDLPVGQISAPVPYHGQYLLIQLVDVRTEPVPSSGAARAPFEQVVFHRKAKALAREFIRSMMEPLDVRVRPATYRRMRDMLWEAYRSAPPEGRLLPALVASGSPVADSLRVLAGAVLITTADGDWTVGDFLAAFPATRYPLRHDSRESFESDLYDAIGLAVRDRYFVRRATQEGLDQDPELRHELSLWTDKWVGRAMREALSESEETVSETFRRLRRRYPVIIHHAVLDTLTLSAPERPGLTVLKGHTLRPAFPVADPVW